MDRARSLLAELGLEPKLTVYLASAPGSGKTHRLLHDAIAQQRGGRRVAIGWVETKDRPDLDALVAQLPVLPARAFVTANGATYRDFDLAAALASNYETFVLDELAHQNPDGAAHAKRWQDALALRRAGRSVLGAFNVQHLETVAPVAERIIGHPIREIVPVSFLKEADDVIALDVSPTVLESRLRSGRIVRSEDIERAALGPFKPQNLELLRQLLLRTVDDLTLPVVSPSKTSNALAIVTPEIDPRAYLRRVAALADALDLAVETTTVGRVDRAVFDDAARDADAVRIEPVAKLDHGDLTNVRANLVTVTPGELATKILMRPVDRTVFIADPRRVASIAGIDGARHPYAHIAGDRMRIGYGTLTIYLGSAAGSGKTYAMLDRAHQLRAEGVDVVAALVETHGRKETAEKVAGLETIARLANGEMDRETLLARRPQVALIDELAHSNVAGSTYAKRYDEVIAILRAGIDVLTTLNVQHLEGLGDAVERLTGTVVRETLPDSILELAEEVIFVDVTPDVLRQRLRDGKIYPPERVEAALANFFRTENLAALRELAVRELVHARGGKRHARPFERIVLGVSPRERDRGLIERMGRLASRLDVDLRVVVVAHPGEELSREAVTELERAAKAVRAKFFIDRGEDAALRLVEIAMDGDVIAVESPRRPRRPFGKVSFALRLLRAGASELLILAPR